MTVFGADHPAFFSFWFCILVSPYYEHRVDGWWHSILF